MARALSSRPKRPSGWSRFDRRAGEPIRDYRNGRDLADRPRGVMARYLFGFLTRKRCNAISNGVFNGSSTVKPERDQNRTTSYRDNWWIFGENRAGTGAQCRMDLQRFIATITETTKHERSSVLDAAILPDNMLVSSAMDDGHALGPLQPPPHRLGTRRWRPTRRRQRPALQQDALLRNLPFPDATAAQQTRIGELAEQLDAHRKRQQAAHAG